MGRAQKLKAARKEARRNQKPSKFNGVDVFGLIRKIRYPLGIVVFAIVVVFVYRANFSERGRATQHLRAVTNEYRISRSRPDRFWLHGNEEVSQRYGLIQAKTRNVLKVLDQYADVHPLAKRIRKELPDLYACEAYQGVMYMVGEVSDDSFLDSHTMTDRSIGLCFSGKLHAAHHRELALFYFHRDPPSMMAAAVELNDVWLAALSFHELGHGLRNLVDRHESSNASTSSDLYAFEEIQMHDLEAAILDAATNGRVTEFYRTIVKRSGGEAVGLDRIFLSLGVEDFYRFEEITGAVNPGMQLAGVFAAQMIYGLVDFVLHERDDLTPDEKVGEKIKRYRQGRSLS